MDQNELIEKNQSKKSCETISLMLRGKVYRYCQSHMTGSHKSEVLSRHDFSDSLDARIFDYALLKLLFTVLTYFTSLKLPTF